MEEQKGNIYTIIAVATLVAILLSCVAGGFAGGIAGLLAGRRAARIAADRALDSALDDLGQLRREMMERLPERWLIPEPPSGEEPGPTFGAIVQEVVPDTAADRAGLRPGDLIIAIDQTPINRDHPLPDIIAQYEPNDRVTIHIWRMGQRESVRVILGEHPDDPDQAYLGVYFREMPAPQFERPLD
jgi:hypothetical protein